MNKLVLLAVLLCLVAVNARHFREHSDSELLKETDSHAELIAEREHDSPPRHRKRRWQEYGYNYQPPHYYVNRRDSYNNDELIPQIFRLLDEISAFIRRPQPPPPPPQPIYIPYPIPYYIPKIEETKPNITNKGGFPEDSNRNWGLVTNDLPDEVYDDSDGARPISFEPIKPKLSKSRRPQPDVERGNSRANQATTRAPLIEEIESPIENTITSMCNITILKCCNSDDKKKCFTDAGCGKTYSNGAACSFTAITNAIEAIRLTYSATN